MSGFVPAFPPYVAPDLARAEQWERFAVLRDRVEHDGAALAEVRAVLAPVEASLWDEADACATGSDADRAAFARRAFAPVDTALTRLRV